MKHDIVIKPLITGSLAGAALLGIYFGLLSFANSPEHALQQFLGMWYWILALTFGFAVQVGLFVYARDYMKGRARAGAAAELAGTGTVSTGSMVACCAHHLSDVLPLLGISAALLFLNKYQFFFVVLGLVSNLVGITIMLGIIQKHNLYHEPGILAKILTIDMRKMRNAAIAVSLLILGVVFFTSCNPGYTPPGSDDGLAASPPMSTQSSQSPSQVTDQGGAPAAPIKLPEKTNSEAGISIQVVPEAVAPGKPLSFRVSIDTHSGSLDFSLTKVALLKDDKGNEYLPQEWQGSPPGGHHVSGVLVFPPLKEQPQSLTLILKDIGGVRERIFYWS